MQAGLSRPPGLGWETPAAKGTITLVKGVKWCSWYTHEQVGRPAGRKTPR